MNKPKVLIAGLIAIVVILAVVRTIVTNSISTGGVALGKIEEETKSLKTSKLIYKEKILSYSSLSHISQNAKKMGLVDAPSGFVVSKTVSIAAKQ